MLEYKGFLGFLILCFVLISQATFSQSNTVLYGLGSNSKQYTFKPSDSPLVEIVRDKVNIAIASTNGLKLEIKNFSIRQLKCGSLVYCKTAQFVLTSNNLRYCSKLNEYKNSLGIICMGKNQYRFYVKGTLYNALEKVKLSAQLNCRIE